MRRQAATGMAALAAIAGSLAIASSAAGRPLESLSSAQRDGVRSVVIDTDMGADDWMAILYLLKRRDVDVRAITVSGTGLAHCGPGVRNALGLLALSGENDVPVACGRTAPLRGRRSFTAQWRRDADTVLGVPLPKRKETAARPSAASLITKSVRSTQGGVSLIALGPLTNVAEALLADAALARKLEAVYVMGGALTVAGNVDGSAAEWNLYVDPYAADVVLGSQAPITLIPLDATNDVPVTRRFVERIAIARRTREADFVSRVLTRQAFLIDTGDYFFWDPLAAVAFTDSSLIGIQRRSVEVVTRGQNAGSTRITRGGTPIRVAVSAKRARFERAFWSILNS